MYINQKKQKTSCSSLLRGKNSYVLLHCLVDTLHICSTYLIKVRSIHKHYMNA